MTVNAILAGIEASPWARRGVKTALVLVATVGSVFVFGIAVPITLIAYAILPDLGLAGLVYVWTGGAIGGLFGAISTATSLARTERLASRYYLVYAALLVLLSLAYWAICVFAEDRIMHV